MRHRDGMNHIVCTPNTHTYYNGALIILWCIIDIVQHTMLYLFQYKFDVCVCKRNKVNFGQRKGKLSLIYEAFLLLPYNFNVNGK